MAGVYFCNDKGFMSSGTIFMEDSMNIGELINLEGN
jgi:hypothetical protein